MNLTFNGKRKYNEIIDDAKRQSIELTMTDKANSLLLFGDNYIGLGSLLKDYENKVDLVYIDPPFNTNQSFVYTDNRVSTISMVKNGKVAYQDNMAIDDYLTFMYDRFVLIHKLLSEKGSLYVHIDLKMGHYFKVMLDEIFGVDNYKNDITRIKSNPKNFSRKAYGNQKDMILFYSKNSKKNIWNNVTIQCDEKELESKFSKVDENGRRYTTIPLHAPGESNGPTGQPWRGMNPPEGRHWRTNPSEFDIMDENGLIEWSKNGNPRIKKYADEHKGEKIQDIWKFKDPQYPLYPTQKNLEMLEMIIQQSSNENSIVLDCFAGSGTTLYAAAKLKRKFIGIDNSEFAIATIEKRINEANINYEKVNI